MNRLHPIIGAMSSQITREFGKDAAQFHRPFITISRQIGAGANTLAHQLVTMLEQIDPVQSPAVPWTAFDRNLTDKVAQDYHLSKRLIDSIGESHFNWIRELFDNISSTHTSVEAEQVKAYRAVVKTMWALAHAGRVVLVDRGGVFVTESLPQGVHLRLTAPRDFRIKNIAKERGLSIKEAEQDLTSIEQKRQAFFQQFWPGRQLGPESFTATYNTARLDQDQIANSVSGLVKMLNERR